MIGRLSVSDDYQRKSYWIKTQDEVIFSGIRKPLEISLTCGQGGITVNILSLSGIVTKEDRVLLEEKFDKYEFWRFVRYERDKIHFYFVGNNE